ncbi:MAG: beta-lactamase family protein [Anaerolineales bacterium]|nr:beta-lactamase family protein [Anaerolineales bacterium]
MLISRKCVLPLLIVAALLVTTGCQPIRPVPVDAPPSVAATATLAPATFQLEGIYSGALSIAGLELAITVYFTPEGDGYTGAIDIPEQGVTGLPLHDIRVDGTNAHFEMLEGPSLAAFAGELTGRGQLSGVFTQGGVEGSFILYPAAADAGAAAAVTAGVGETYTDPAGRFSVPIPTNWTVTEGDGYVLLMDPEESIKMYLVVAPGVGTALEQATADAWAMIDPAFDVAIDETVEPPAGSDIDQILVTNYETGDANRIVQAVAQAKHGDAYLLLIDGELAALQKRNAQVTIVGSGFKILAIEETDLSAVAPLPITDAITAPLAAFITKYMAAFGVPGAAVGIVEDGELVYAQGFGVADPESGAPMAPDTNVMIGSTGKSLTTLMMGALVDDGIMTWDTPAIELYPAFKVADPALTEQITMRNLVCACTGVPRRDLELIFNASEQSAADTVAALADFEFFTDFGEAFQYSNQMVATAGYIAANAAQGGGADLESEYEQALQERVLDPIGMENTTLSFDKIRERGNYAIPHMLTLQNTYAPITLDDEAVLTPIAPAGLHWSTLEDMAKYMVTQLHEGVAPDGTRVVSAENLKETWKPQIAISNDVSYGLGWIVSDYKGQPLISHDGNTIGFTSSFTFLPGRDLGVIVLTNGRATNLFNEGVAGRLLELVYAQPAETEQAMDFYLEQMAKQTEKLVARIQDEVDAAAVEPWLGRFSHPALGTIELSLDAGKLMLDAGEFVTELKPLRNDDGELDGYIQLNVPLQGLVYKFEQAEDGANVIVVGEGASQYTFVRSD